MNLIEEGVNSKLEIFSADKTGMADYALESAGAEIIEEYTTSGLPTAAPMVKLWNWPLFYQTMSARIAIQPNVNPGNCFAFSGHKGHMGIKLSHQIIAQNITIEHIPKVNFEIPKIPNFDKNKI